MIAHITREAVPHPGKPRYRFTLVVNGRVIDQRVGAQQYAPIAMRRLCAALNGKPAPREHRGGHNKMATLDLWPLFDAIRQK